MFSEGQADIVLVNGRPSIESLANPKQDKPLLKRIALEKVSKMIMKDLHGSRAKLGGMGATHGSSGKSCSNRLGCHFI